MITQKPLIPLLGAVYYWPLLYRQKWISSGVQKNERKWATRQRKERPKGGVSSLYSGVAEA